MTERRAPGGTDYHDELFTDGLTTYWVTTQDGLRSANEAVAFVAHHAGPFRSWIRVELVAGRMEWQGAEGWFFHKDAEGDEECWEVDAE